MKVKKQLSNGVLASNENNNGESQLEEENAMVIIKK